MAMTSRNFPARLQDVSLKTPITSKHYIIQITPCSVLLLPIMKIAKQGM
jgi:hypothetical protein